MITSPPLPGPGIAGPNDGSPVGRFIIVGEGEAARRIAMLVRPGASPGLFWLGGYRSDMRGTKAAALDSHAAARGWAMTRFDYTGHGESGGRFEDGTISRWLEEAEAAFATTTGPQVAIGSSMGGWIALLLAQRLRATGSSRLAGLVLIAPAVDMTEDLMWGRMTRPMRDNLRRTGLHLEPSPYSGEPLPITLGLIEDGRKHLFGEGLIETGCPVHILQGALDQEVPAEHTLALVSRLASDDVVLTLVKDGDHRLSRPEDIGRMLAAVDGIVAEVGTG